MKFIKKFVGLTFVLSMLVVCFMSSTMVAHAGRHGTLCEGCGKVLTSMYTSNPEISGFVPDGYCSDCASGGACTYMNRWFAGGISVDGSNGSWQSDPCTCQKFEVLIEWLDSCKTCSHAKSYHTGGSSTGGTGIGAGTGSGNMNTPYTPPVHFHSYGPTSWGQWSYTNSSNHSRTGTATCTSTTGTCSAPTAPRSESQPHTWNWTEEYRTLSNSQHERKRTCAICGGAEWVALTHDWIEPPPQVVDPTQEIDFSNLKVTVRSLSDTQCEREMVCSECGATKWETRNHNYTTGAQFISVSATQHGRVQTCEYCSHQRNSALSDHVFETTIVKGTDGHQVVKRCAVCFYTDGSSAMQPHDYGAPQVTESNGVKITTKVCNTCGYRDQVFELAQTTGGNEIAIVLSDPMTLDDIKGQARTSSTSPAWKAAIGTEGDFDTSKATSEDYVWHYNKRAYGLSKRPDGLYYIVLLPSYYDARITAKNPDGSSANVSQTKVRAVMRAASSRGRSSTTTSNVSQLGSNGKPTSEYAGAMAAGGKAGMSWGGINGTPPSQQSWSYGGSTYSWVTDSSGRTVTGPYGMPMIQRTDTHTSSSSSGSYSSSGGGGGYYPPVYVHHHSYSYKYKDKTDTQHTKTTIVCGGSCGSSEAVENHNYGNWTYTDLGPELHRAERV